MAKKPPLKALPGNEDLLVAFKVRSKKSRPHSIIIWIRSAIDDAGKLRLILYVQARKFLHRLRLDTKDVADNNAFVKLSSEVANCNSYESLLAILKAYGFPEIKETPDASDS